MEIKKKKKLQGRIVSDKMEKTRIVEIKRKVKHPLYEKIVNKTTKFMAHDEKNETKIGDIVEITYKRPMSKQKSWEILSILEKISE